MPYDTLSAQIHRSASYGISFAAVAFASSLLWETVSAFTPSSWTMAYALFALTSFTLGIFFWLYIRTIHGFCLLGEREDFAPLSRAGRFYQIATGSVFIAIELIMIWRIFLPSAHSPLIATVFTSILNLALLLYVVAGMRVAITILRLHKRISLSYLPLIACGSWIPLMLIGIVSFSEPLYFFVWVPLSEVIFALTGTYLFRRES